MEYKDPGRYILIIFLLYSWGSLFGVPSKVPLEFRVKERCRGLEGTAGFKGFGWPGLEVPG